MSALPDPLLEKTTVRLYEKSTKHNAPLAKTANRNPTLHQRRNGAQAPATQLHSQL